jgi:hypothetical protein
MIYISAERQKFKCENWKQVVRRLYVTSFDEAQSKGEYMFNVKERVEEVYNKHIATENYKQFCLDLAELNLIKIYRCCECKWHQDVPMKCQLGIKADRNKIECPMMEIREVDEYKEKDDPLI